MCECDPNATLSRCVRCGQCTACNVCTCSNAEITEQAITEAADKLRDAISLECGRLADQILGRPEFGSPEWLAEAEVLKADDEAKRAAVREWHLVKIRILHAAELNPTGDVMNARMRGATWQAIGDACGTSRQAAHDRWAQLTTIAGFDSTTTPEDDAR
jgi:aconitase B